MRITQIMSYYDNPTMLKRQLENIASYDPELKEKLELIIIDDCSPRWPATIEVDPGVPVRLFRTLVDIRWNQDFCRNLGAMNAKTDWLLLTDIDHLVPEDTMAGLFKMKDLKRQVAYKFDRVSAPDMQPYKPHPNSWLMTRDFYWVVGGYDERFAGYYGTDGDFRDRINLHTNIVQLPLPIIRVGREVIPDASTTTLERKTPEDGAAIQRIKEQRGSINVAPVVMSFPWEEILSPEKEPELL